MQGQNSLNSLRSCSKRKRSATILTTYKVVVLENFSDESLADVRLEFVVKIVVIIICSNFLTYNSRLVDTINSPLPEIILG